MALLNSVPCPSPPRPAPPRSAPPRPAPPRPAPLLLASPPLLRAGAGPGGAVVHAAAGSPAACPPRGFTGFAVGGRERQKVEAERVKLAHFASELLAADIDQVVAVDGEAANVNAGVEGAPPPIAAPRPSVVRRVS
jgi:hypothetical protein